MKAFLITFLVASFLPSNSYALNSSQQGTLSASSARQYQPFNYQISNIPLIIYPVKDEHPLTEIFPDKSKQAMLAHLDSLYKNNARTLTQGNYHILFVWNLDHQIMTDVWVHNMKNWSDTSGPLIDCYTFKGLELTHDAGIASGDSIIVLGREEELRRRLGQIAVNEYADRIKYLPEFPQGLAPNQPFFVK